MNSTFHRLDISLQIKSEDRLVAFFHPKDGGERVLVFLAPEPETLTTGDKIWKILASSRPLKCSTVREKKLRREYDITLTGAELTPGILNVLGTYLRTLDREALQRSQNSAIPTTSFVDPGTSSTTSAATLAIMDTSKGSSVPAVSRKRGHGDDLGGDSVMAKKRHMDAASVMEAGSSDAPPGLPTSPGHQEIAGPLEALDGPADVEPLVTDESRQPHSAESQATTAPEHHVEPQEEAAEPTDHGATEGSIETDKEAISPLSAPAGTSCDVESPEVSEPLSQSVVTSSVTPAHPTGNQPEQQCSSISGSAESPHMNQPSTSRDQALTGGESHTTLKRKTDNQEEPTQPEKRPSPARDIPEQQTQTVHTQPEIWNWESDEEEEEEEEVRSTDDLSDNLWVPPRSLRGLGAQTAVATRRSSRLADKIAKQLSLHGVRACSVKLQRCVVPAQHDGSTLEQREAPQTSEGNKKARHQTRSTMAEERRKEKNPQNRQVCKPRVYIDLTKRRRSSMAPKKEKEKNRGAIQSDEEYQSVIDELEDNEIKLQETQSTVKERLPLVYEEIRLADGRFDFRQLESSKIRLKPLRLAQKVIIPNLKKEIRRAKKRIQNYKLKMQGLK